jgi:hypothetical protein
MNQPKFLKIRIMAAEYEDRLDYRKSSILLNLNQVYRIDPFHYQNDKEKILLKVYTTSGVKPDRMLVTKSEFDKLLDHFEMLNG